MHRAEADQPALNLSALERVVASSYRASLLLQNVTDGRLACFCWSAGASTSSEQHEWSHGTHPPHPRQAQRTETRQPEAGRRKKRPASLSAQRLLFILLHSRFRASLISSFLRITLLAHRKQRRAQPRSPNELVSWAPGSLACWAPSQQRAPPAGHAR